MLDDGSKSEKRKKDDVTNVPNGVCYRSRLVCLEMGVCTYVHSLQVRKLRITRTYRNHEDGREYTREEIVLKVPVIDFYVKIRQNKDASFMYF